MRQKLAYPCAWMYTCSERGFLTNEKNVRLKQNLDGYKVKQDGQLFQEQKVTEGVAHRNRKGSRDSPTRFRAEFDGFRV